MGYSVQNNHQLSATRRPSSWRRVYYLKGLLPLSRKLHVIILVEDFVFLLKAASFFTKSEEWKASQAVEDKDAESTLPWMPNEIWCRVVQRLDLRKCSYSQLALIWTNLRSVSRLFRDEIENLFQKDILPNMTMNFWLSKYIV